MAELGGLLRAAHTTSRSTRVAALALGLAAIAGGALLVALAGGIDQWAAELARLEAIPSDALDDEKLRQEIIALELANRSAASPWSRVLAVVPLLTAILGGIAIVATVWKQISERSDQARQDRAERERENQRRFAESFKTTVENLAAPEASLRASAAATLSAFLRREYSEYQEELLLVAIAKSKEGMEKDPAVARLIVRAVELALRAQLPSMPMEARGYLLDLSHCQLGRIDLSGLDLAGADLGFADLGGAVLEGTDLRRVRGYGIHLDGARLGALNGRPANLQEARLHSAVAPRARFHNARCTSIRLEEADLQGAEFANASLQEAHLERSDLRGASFHGANLNNAYLAGANLDDAALTTIARGARHWRDAHFDPEVRARLEALSGPEPEPATSPPSSEPTPGTTTPESDVPPGPDAGTAHP